MACIYFNIHTSFKVTDIINTLTECLYLVELVQRTALMACESLSVTQDTSHTAVLSKTS